MVGISAAAKGAENDYNTDFNRLLTFSLSLSLRRQKDLLLASSKQIISGEAPRTNVVPWHMQLDNSCFTLTNTAVICLSITYIFSQLAHRSSLTLLRSQETLQVSRGWNERLDYITMSNPRNRNV